MRLSALSEFEVYVKEMPRAELGGLIKEYIAESNHNGWDGFDRHDLTGIRKLLEDIMIYHKSIVFDLEKGESSDFATKISNVNPVP